MQKEQDREQEEEGGGGGLVLDWSWDVCDMVVGVVCFLGGGFTRGYIWMSKCSFLLYVRVNRTFWVGVRTGALGRKSIGCSRFALCFGVSLPGRWLNESLGPRRRYQTERFGLGVRREGLRLLDPSRTVMAVSLLLYLQRVVWDTREH